MSRTLAKAGELDEMSRSGPQNICSLERHHGRGGRFGVDGHPLSTYKYE